MSKNNELTDEELKLREFHKLKVSLSEQRLKARLMKVRAEMDIKNIALMIASIQTRMFELQRNGVKLVPEDVGKQETKELNKTS